MVYVECAECGAVYQEDSGKCPSCQTATVPSEDKRPRKPTKRKDDVVVLDGEEIAIGATDYHTVERVMALLYPVPPARRPIY